MPALSFLLALVLAASGYMAVGPKEGVRVFIEGSGPPIVLVPGLSGCAYGYRGVAPLLREQGFRTIIIEPLAVGESTRPRGADYTLTAQSGRIATVMRRLRVKKALVVAHGVSFSMALRLALDEPDLVDALVSIEGGPAETAATPTVRTGLKMAKVLIKIVGDDFIREGSVKILEKSSGDPSWINMRTIHEYIRGPRSDMNATLDAVIAMAEQPEPYALKPRLGEITQPVLVLLGDAEHRGAVSEEDIATLRDGLPDVTFRTVPGAGHFIFEEQPETTAAAIIEFYSVPPTEVHKTSAAQ
jgi:pimeloyl-ACP methyl ester carboxylesterase